MIKKIELKIKNLIIYIFGAYLVVFTLFVIVLAQLNVSVNKLFQTKKHLQKIAVSFQKIVKNQDFLFINNRNYYYKDLQEFDIFFDEIKISKNEIDSINEFASNRNIQKINNKIELQFENYYKNSQLIIEINSEIYKPDVGIVSRYNLIDNKVRLNKDYSNAFYVSVFDTLKRNSEMLLSNKITKREYQQKAKKIFSNLEYLSQNQTNNISISTFVDYFSDYYNTIILQYDKLKQIGMNYNEGLLSILNTNQIIISEDIEKMDDLIENMLRKFNINMIFLVFSFVFILLILTGLVIYIFYKNFYKSIQNTLQTLEKLSVGTLSAEPHETNIFELRIINKNILDIENSLKSKENIINQLTNKKYDLDYTFPKQDQIGQALSTLQKELVKSEKEAEQYRETEMHQKWIATGIAKIGAIMRQYADNIDDLSKNILKSTIEYVDAVQGVMYLYNTEKKCLEQTAAYSYGKNRLTQTIIQPYEGLIGTILVEKKSYFLEEISEDYLFFETGFGYGKPKSLFSFPLLFENKIYGVIEIASMEVIAEYKRTFLLTLAHEIANTISYVEINIRTKKLLEQSNKQAQELISNQKLFKKNQENLKSLLKMTEEQLSEKSDLLKDRERTIKEKVDIIFQLEKDIISKEEIIENVTTEFENVRKMMEYKINEQQRKIDELQRRLNELSD